jgi:Homeodomain-like domain
MFAFLHSLAMFLIDFFKSPRRLEAENLFLRHQLSIALRRAPPRLRLRGSDRALMVWMTRRWPSLLGAAHVVQPETILRWHRAGFTALWRWKSRKRAGRPKIDRELRDLIRRMSKENPRWGASRIHGELLMLGFEVAQSTVSKYMVRGGSPSQTWKTFFRNHAQGIAAIDLFVVPKATHGDAAVPHAEIDALQLCVECAVIQTCQWHSRTFIFLGRPVTKNRDAGDHCHSSVDRPFNRTEFQLGKFFEVAR